MSMLLSNSFRSWYRSHYSILLRVVENYYILIGIHLDGIMHGELKFERKEMGDFQIH